MYISLSHHQWWFYPDTWYNTHAHWFLGYNSLYSWYPQKLQVFRNNHIIFLQGLEHRYSVFFFLFKTAQSFLSFTMFDNIVSGKRLQYCLWKTSTTSFLKNVDNIVFGKRWQHFFLGNANNIISGKRLAGEWNEVKFGLRLISILLSVYTGFGIYI